MNTILQSIALATTLLFATSAFAMPQAGATAAKPAKQTCRDGKGKFIKCEAAKPAKQTCRDDKGKFTKCPAAPAATAAKK
ncbi:hypothetical protein [Thermomonas sp.]|jgi:hypothetical protein|uniref:hypothetical protein n=1 Tax=Thermomonas sp. TaxID=1971895 RepID=UPI001AD5CF91|nr:hypothetical protein [Xanthomonadales bacterium]MBN8794462.1 hypothetical protein [Stenotrophomonas nitritireducens]